jgi:hypothetical protein
MYNGHRDILSLSYRADIKDRFINCRINNEHIDILPLSCGEDRRNTLTVSDRVNIETSCLSAVGRKEKTSLSAVKWI